VAIRPAQGELSELILDVPTGATVRMSWMSQIGEHVRRQSFRRRIHRLTLGFDPDTRKLRSPSTLTSRPFGLMIRHKWPGTIAVRAIGRPDLG